MRTVFVGDVHGCARTLGALLQRAEPTRLILLGDLFAKGPDPAGVWQLVKKYKAESVMGNHDARLLEVWGRDGSYSHHKTWRKLDQECREWLAARPIFLHGEGWVAVHAGVHPTGGWSATTSQQAMVMRRWPDDDPANPFWWQRYAGPERIFYGHDAMRGLRVREKTVGLDSGCTYGLQLSAYILEEERVVQVEYQDDAPPRTVG